MRASRGFTLTELLVVIAILALLAGVLLPALRAIQKSSRATRCLGNLRQLELAHVGYMSDNLQRFAEVDVFHCAQASDDDESAPTWVEGSWVEALRAYYDSDLVLRSPLDTSPHWPTHLGGQGVPVPAPNATGCLRWTSYGFNTFVTPNKTPYAYLAGVVSGIDQSDVADRLTKVRSPPATVHFLVVSFTGPFASADHADVEKFGQPHPNGPPGAAAVNGLQVNAVGGPDMSWGSRSNYAFLDGHVETLMFSEVYSEIKLPPAAGEPDLAELNFINRFDPRMSWRWVNLKQQQ